MYRFISLQFLLVVIVMLPYSVESQIVPKEGAVLNYRLISFSAGPEHSPGYTLEIAAGSYYSEDSFRKNIIKTLAGKTNRIIAEVPSFGSPYTWRVVYQSGKTVKAKSDLHHFAAGAIAEADTNNTRLRITTHALKFNDAYVFLDGNKSLYDMEGHPVWYLPMIEGNAVLPTDLKLTPQGTITFLANNQAYEINYEGVVLWKAPNNGAVSGDKEEHYHHEFTRLNNGHYMVMGSEMLTCQLLSSGDSCFRIVAERNIKQGPNDHYVRGLPFGNIIEYDSQGNVIWSWKSSKYFQESDLNSFRQSNGNSDLDLHQNAFFFDEKDAVIYLSFKQISRVIKIKYPEGTVTNTYGELYKTGNPVNGNGFYCGQHSCRRSQDGSLFLFNNNGCNDGPPEIEKLREPASGGNKLEKIWDYQCPVEDNAPKKLVHGGNVSELPDGSIFACVGGDYGKTLIVNPDKKILWSAIPEKWNETEKKWTPIPQYRASIISNRKDMERLIWNTDKKNEMGR